MYIKNDNRWSKKSVKYANIFDKAEFIDKYEKCSKSATYSITRNNIDIYDNIKYQHVLWCLVTDLSENNISIFNIEMKKGKTYNLLKYATLDEILKSDIFIYLNKGYVKLATNEIFDNDLSKDWFKYLTSYKKNVYLDKQFDYLTIEITPLTGYVYSEIDSATRIVNTGSNKQFIAYNSTSSVLLTDIDNTYVGCGKYNYLSDINNNKLLEFSDNILDDKITIRFNNIIEYINTDNVVIDLNSYFYWGIEEGHCLLTITTYLDSKIADTYHVARKLTTISQDSSTIGDNIGSIVYNRITKNAILTIENHNNINNFSETLYNTNFDEVIWNMGTSGYSYSTYSDSLINENNYDNVNDIFQNSDTEYGYTQNNVFSNDKVWNNLLNNYYVIDYASTSNIIIDKYYDKLYIDGYQLIENNIVLLKDQDFLNENNLYIFNNGYLKSYITEEKIKNLSCSIKYGITNKNKEYYLDRNENGSYPSLIYDDYTIYYSNFNSTNGISNSEFNFKECNSVALRNKFDYRTASSHNLVSSKYVKSVEYTTVVDFSNRLYIGDSYYEVSEDNLNLNYYNNVLVSKPFGDNKKALSRINYYDGNIYLIIDNIICLFQSFTNNNVNYIEIFTPDYNIIDYHISNNKTYILDDSNNIHYLLDFVEQQVFNVKNNISEIRYYNENTFICSGNEHINYIDLDNLYDINIIEDKNISNIRIENNNINYLSGIIPIKVILDIDSLLNLHNINHIKDYKVKEFSKTKIGDWEIKDDNLYLKNTILKSNNNLPKIDNTDMRLLDSSTIEIDNKVFDKLKLSDSFTIEFNIKPQNEQSSSIFYFGEKIKYLTDSTVLPKNYITFLTSDETGYPLFIINNDILNYKIYCNEKLSYTDKTHIAIVYVYTTSSVKINIYFDSKLVGSGVFTDNIISIKNFNFEINTISQTVIDYKNFVGYISDLRFWNTALNSLTINTRRYIKNIPETDILYNNVIAYWSLIDNIVEYYNNYYIKILNTLNDSVYLENFENEIVKNIQISDNNTNLYVLTDTIYTKYEDKLDGSGTDSTTFWNRDFSDNIVDYESTSMLRLTSPIFNELKSNKLYNFNKGDIITASFDYYSEDTSGVVLFAVIYDFNGFEDSTVIELDDIGWNKINIEYQVPTNGVDSISYQILSNKDVTYIKDFIFEVDKRFLPSSNIYSIDLNKELITKLKDNVYYINSIYYDSYIYYLQNSFVKNISDITIGQETNAKEFAKYNDNLYIVDALNDVYKDNELIYSIDNYNKFYAFDDCFYYTDINDEYIYIVSLLDDTYQLISTYPLKESQSITDFSAYLIDNKVYIDNILLDNDFNNTNIKKIVGIYRLDNSMLIPVIDNDNNILVYNYNVLDKRSIKYADYDNNSIFFNTINDISFTYYEYNNNLYFLFGYLDKMIFYRIENGDGDVYKFNYNYINQTINIENNILDINSNNPYDFIVYNIIDDEKNVSLYRIENDYSLPEKQIDVNYTNKGFVVGEYGICFSDNGDFNLIYENILTRDDIYSVDIEKIISTNDKNLTSITYTNNFFMCGKNGLFIKYDKDNNDVSYKPTNTYNNLNALSFYDERNGLIVGDNNTILYTFNGGETFGTLNFYSTQNWKDVIYYQSNRAIIIGNNGKIISLSLEKNTWVFDKVDDSYNIPIITNNALYTQNLNSIKYIDNKFYIVGDNNMIIELSLSFIENKVLYYIKYLISDIINDWKKIDYIKDYNNNENKIILSSSDNIYYSKVSDNLILNLLNSDKINNISVLDNYIYTFGNSLYANRYDIYSTDNLLLDLKNNFKPKHVILDYSYARKSNDSNVIFKLPKDLLNCYSFNINDYIIVEQIDNGYLKYQDLYLLNRNMLDVPNSQGLLQLPFEKYNKTIIAFNSKHFTGSYEIVNEPVTNLLNYNISEVRYDTNATKIKIDSSIIFDVNKYDNIYISITEDNNEYIKKGDKLFIQIEADIINIFETVEIEELSNSLYFTIDNVTEYFSKTTKISDLLTYIKSSDSKIYEYVNNELKNRCIKPKFINTNILVDDYSLQNISIVNYVLSSDNNYFMAIKKINYAPDGFINVYDNNHNIISTIQLNAEPIEMVINTYNNCLVVKCLGYKETIGNKYFITIIDLNNYNIIASDISISDNISNLIYREDNNRLYYVSDNIFNILNYTNIKYSLVLEENINSISYDNETLIALSDNNMFIIANENDIYKENIVNVKKSIIYDNYVYLITDKLLVYDINSKLIIKTYNYLVNDIKIIDKKLVFSHEKSLSFIDLESLFLEKSITTIADIYSFEYSNIEDKIYIFTEKFNNQYYIYTVNFNNYNINEKSFISDNILYLYKANNIIGVTKSPTNIYYIIKSEEIFPDDIIINVEKSLFDTTSILKNKKTFNGKHIYELSDYWNDEMVYEMNNKKIYIYNLNRFNTDLKNLKCVFDKHLLSEAYNLIIDDKDSIIVEGKINDNTLYYNLESNIYYSIDHVQYSSKIAYEDTIYNPSYNLYKLLNNINPDIFTSVYQFDMPDKTFLYNNNIITNNLYSEFTISENKIYIGEDIYINYVENLFYDITPCKHSIPLFLKKIEYSNYFNSDKKRYCLIFDTNIEKNIYNFSGNFRLYGRKALSTISDDLNYTDNINFPINIYNFKERYFKNFYTIEAYTKIICNDPNIRKYCSVVTGNNENNDLTLNVIDYITDPNLSYKPIELYEIGYDKVFKKAISVENYNLNYESFISLVDINYDVFNYFLTDSLTVKKLETDYKWMINNIIKNAIIGEDGNGLVWYKGDFICGEVQYLTMYNSTIYDIIWNDGVIKGNDIENNYNIIKIKDTKNTNNINVYKAYWINGEFYGNWYTGEFFNGKFNGNWNGGKFYGGDFEGNFLGGDFYNGTMINSLFCSYNSNSVWYEGTLIDSEFGSGIWKNGRFTSINGTSSFGTLSTDLTPAIWEYGYFENSLFYSNKEKPNFSAIWKNGIFSSGTVYGGNFEYINVLGGKFYNAIVDSILDVDSWNIRREFNVEGCNVDIKFKNKHYFKNILVNDELLENYITIMGIPEINKGVIHPNVESLGYNSKPTKHLITEILDDYTITIFIEDTNFPYPINYVIDDVEENVFFDTDIYQYYFDMNQADDIQYYNNYLYINMNSINTIIKFDYSNPSSEYKRIQTSYSYTNATLSDKPLFVNDNMYFGYKDFSKYREAININNYDVLFRTYVINNINNATIMNPTDFWYNESRNTIIYRYGNYYRLGVMTNIQTGDSFILDLNQPYGSMSAIATVGKYIYIGFSNLNRIKIYDLDNFSFKQDIILNNNSYVKTMNIKNNKILVNTTNSIVTIIDETAIIDNYVASSYFYEKNSDNVFLIQNNIVSLRNDIYINQLIESTYNIVDIVFSNFYNHYFIATDQNKILLYNEDFIFIDEIIIDKFIKKLVIDEIGKNVYGLTTDQYLMCLTQDKNVFLCSECKDYTIETDTVIDSKIFDFSTYQYTNNPRIASYWENTNLENGYIKYIYMSSGNIKGGFVDDAIIENSTIGD